MRTSSRSTTSILLGLCGAFAIRAALPVLLSELKGFAVSIDHMCVPSIGPVTDCAFPGSPRLSGHLDRCGLGVVAVMQDL